MDIKTLLSNADPNIIIFLMTTLIAFFSWLVKSLVEKPITESKNTFNRFFEKRIEILTEIKTRLNLIAYFPKGKESDEYKNQLQEIFLKDGKIGYLNKETFNSVMKISIDPVTDEELLLKTITDIDKDLYAQISKVQDEIGFYRKFSNYNPLKRFISLTLLSLQYMFSFIIVFGFLFLLTHLFFTNDLIWKIGIIIISIIIIYLTNKWV